MPKGKKAHPDPDDVLEGRVRPAVRDLISLIHDVNPSGHDHLPAREMARRYAQKSRLQSLLVRRFADDLDVEPILGEPHLASLRHRSSGVDACHAVVAELDDDARSWVQHALDLAALPPSAPADPLPRPARAAPVPQAEIPTEQLSLPELIERGREAISAYDYDLARERLDAALAQESDEAAALLLELLVDILGADGEALAMEPRLPPAAFARSDVRRLLALANARAGDRAAALTSLADLPASERTAAVFVALGRRAVEAGDAQEAQRDLEEARLRSPVHPDLLGLAAAIETLLAPLEEEAQRALAEGRVAEAYARAAELLARFPESKVGKRIARRQKEEQRLEEAARIAGDAEEALLSGALDKARWLVQKARADGLGADRVADLEARLAELQAEERARVEAAQIDRVVRLLGESSDLAPGLLAYLALVADGRAAVQARCSVPLLGWLDQTGITEGSGAHAKAAVLAVQALARAEASLASDPQAALDLLAPHRKALAAVTLAETIGQAASRALADERHRKALEQLEAAERAFAEPTEDAPERAQAQLEAVRARDLDEGARSRFHAFEQRVHAALGRRNQRRQLAELRGKGDLMNALRMLKELIESSEDPGELEEHREARVAVRAEIHKTYDVRVERLPVHDGGSPGKPGSAPMPPGAWRRLVGPEQRDPPRSILPGGREMIVARTAGLWVFLFRIDIATGEVKERGRLRSRAPIRIQRLVLEAGRLYLMGRTCTMLELDPVSFEPLWELTSLVSPDCSIDVTIAPGGRYTWMVSGIQGCFDIDVWDTERGQWSRHNRETTRDVYLRPLFGLAPRPEVELTASAVAVLRPIHEESITLHAAHGTQTAVHRKIWLVERSLVVHPCGETLFALELRKSDATHPIRYRCVELTPKGVPLPMTDPEAREIPCFVTIEPIEIVVDAEGLIFLRFNAEDGACKLLGWKTRGRGSARPSDGSAHPIEALFCVAVPARTSLVEDPAGGSAVAIARYDDGFEVVRLGEAPPVFRPEPPGVWVPRKNLPDVTRYKDCDRPTGTRLQALIRHGGELFHQPDAAIRARIERARREGPVPLVDLVHAITYAQNMPLRSEAVEVAVAAYPDHPEVLLLDAHYQIWQKRWDVMRERLLRIDPAALEPALGRHVHHLLAMATLMLGDRAEALSIVRRGEVHEGICDLGLALAFALPFDDAGAATRPWKPEERVARELLRAVSAADTCLADGDLEGAIRTVDTLLVHDVREVQSLARLAEAHLAVAPGGSIDPFDKALALAAFCGAHGEQDAFTRCELPVSFPRWDTARLDELAGRARAWLDAAPPG